MTCLHHKIVEEINKAFPKSNWNCDDACKMWRKRSLELKDKHIKHAIGSDKAYSCTCPMCGEIVCSWCL